MYQSEAGLMKARFAHPIFVSSDFHISYWDPILQSNSILLNGFVLPFFQHLNKI